MQTTVFHSLLNALALIEQVRGPQTSKELFIKGVALPSQLPPVLPFYHSKARAIGI